MTFNEFITKLEEDVFNEFMLGAVPLSRVVPTPTKKLLKNMDSEKMAKIISSTPARIANKIAGAAIPQYRPFSVAVGQVQKKLAQKLKQQEQKKKAQQAAPQNQQQPVQQQQKTPLGQKMLVKPSVVKKLKKTLGGAI